MPLMSLVVLRRLVMVLAMAIVPVWALASFACGLAMAQEAATPESARQTDGSAGSATHSLSTPMTPPTGNEAHDTLDETALQAEVNAFVEGLRHHAQRGEANAQTQLGLLYHYGRGVAHSYDEAAGWFLKAAKQNDSVAQNMLGHYYQSGTGGLKLDLKRARTLYEQSAAQGNMVAEYQLGMLYYRGLGVPVDYKQSAYWSERSANQGFLKAQNNIAFLYLKGLGVRQDFIEAYKWYYLAALQGNSISALMRNQIGKALGQQDLLEAQWRIDDYREAYEARLKTPETPAPTKLPTTPK